MFDERVADFAERRREIERRLAEYRFAVLRPSRRREQWKLGLMVSCLAAGGLLFGACGVPIGAVLGVVYGGRFLHVMITLPARSTSSAEAIVRSVVEQDGLARLPRGPDAYEREIVRVVEHFGFERRGNVLLDRARAAPRIAEARAQVLRLLRKGSWKRWRFAQRYGGQPSVTLALEQLEEEGVVAEREARLCLAARPSGYRD